MGGSEQFGSALPSPPVEVHLITQNLNGSLSKGCQGHCSQMPLYLRHMEVKPDFLALQDSVWWGDVEHFIEVLNQRYPGSKYNHAADRWTRNVHSTSFKLTALYSEN